MLVEKNVPLQSFNSFGIVAKVALVSHSDFGDCDTPVSLKMREAVAVVRTELPDLEVDGEMQLDTALLEPNRDRKMPGSSLRGQANLLVFPDLSSANAALQMVKVFGDALPFEASLGGQD